MAAFIMLGKYSPSALKEMSPARTARAVEMIQECGGRVESMYATLGPNDLVFVVDLPDLEKAMQASVLLSKLTGIAFTTSPAVTVEQFDKLMS